MFIDETVITVKGGNGGNGCYAMLREKYRPHGGPCGGSGGDGGSVIMQGSHHLHTLQDLDFKKSYKADPGALGKGTNKDGKDAEDICILLPLGTMVYDEASGDLLFDALDEKETFCAARGGRGGKGNAALRTNKNPLPEYAEKGKEGEERRIRLVLKVLADVGLVGRPNAGKSTFLSKITAAHPKIADYPFTTTQPYLGIVRLEGYQSFVVADIPGLIEGSHNGKGLGIRFLKHIERTRVLAILIPADSPDPVAESEVLLHELAAYSPLLAQKPKCFILSKTDLLTDDTLKVPDGWLRMSAVTGNNLPAVLRSLHTLILENAAAEAPAIDDDLV